MADIENKTFDELCVGDEASLERHMSMRDIELFSALSGDINPAHVDPDYAKDDIFHQIVAQGMWSGCLISNLLGTQLPGPGTIYLEQSLKFTAPVLPGDTIRATVRVIEKLAEKHRVRLACECVNQKQKSVMSGIATVIAPQSKVKRKAWEIPELMFKQNHQAWYDKLFKLKDSLAPLLTAVVHPIDAHVLQAVMEATHEGIIKPILIGPKDQILAAAHEAQWDISAYPMIATQSAKDSAERAVQLVKQGEVEAIMKGSLHTQELMAPVVHPDSGLHTGRRMSHVFYIQAPNYFKPLFVSDAAINIKPNLADKKDITQNAIDLFHALGFGLPKVAIICAVESINEAMQSTLDAAALSKMAERGEITGAIVDGPLAFDNAISIDSAREKHIHSSVAGYADILIVPDIESGNILYKEMTFLSELDAAGMVLGAKVPIILISRGSDDISRKASCIMALAYARNRDKIHD